MNDGTENPEDSITPEQHAEAQADAAADAREIKRAKMIAAHQMREDLSDSLTNLEITIGHVRYQSQLVAARFSALVEAGMTRAEALEIVRFRGLS